MYIGYKMQKKFYFLFLLYRQQLSYMEYNNKNQKQKIYITKTLKLMTQSMNHKTKLIYSIIDRNAMKIVTLIKIANLDYEIEQSHDETQCPHILQTPHGQLYKQYEIIFYIVSQSKRISQLQANLNDQQQNNHTSYSRSTVSNAEQITTGEGRPPTFNNDVGVYGVGVNGTLTATYNNAGINLANVIQQQIVINLGGDDTFITVKMHEKLYYLRQSLFPLLHEFYKYLTGFEKTKKHKYDSLMSKIKKQIGLLDADINERPQLYHREFNFLNIIIACEIFMAYKFVFEEKFRKSKYSLLNKYEKITHRKQFIQVHGKSDLCLKEYVPSQFEEQNTHEEKQKEKQKQLTLNKKFSNIQKTNQKNVQNQMSKVANKFLAGNISKMADVQVENSRNQLLYNYFKNIFSQFDIASTGSKGLSSAALGNNNASQQNKHSKKNYFPYFWLMFDDLNCTLVDIFMVTWGKQGEKQQEVYQNNVMRLKGLHTKIMGELNTQTDYGMLGLYSTQSYQGNQRVQNTSSSPNCNDSQGSQKEIPQSSTKNIKSQKEYIIRGLICLGSKPYEEFESNLLPNLSSQPSQLLSTASNLNMNNYQVDQKFLPKLHKIDPSQEKQRQQVEAMWDNVTVNDKEQKFKKTQESQMDNISSMSVDSRNTNQNEHIKLCMIMNF